MSRFLYYLTLQPLYRFWMRLRTPRKYRWMLNKQITFKDGRTYDIVRVKDETSITFGIQKDWK